MVASPSVKGFTPAPRPSQYGYSYTWIETADAGCKTLVLPTRAKN
ncbi:MAG: hypothetical protein RBJ76_26765 [Stenomitos frigidus ULC029]